MSHRLVTESTLGSRIQRMSRRPTDVSSRTINSQVSRGFWTRSLMHSEILFYFNLSTALVQAISAIAIILLTKLENEYVVYSTFPELSFTIPDYTDYSTNTVLIPVPKEIFHVSAGHLSTVYLFLSSLHHAFICTLGRNIYEHYLQRNRAIFRWLEYTITVPIMKVVIGLLCGINDINTLILIVGHTVVTMILGLVFELQNDSDGRENHSVRWRIFWLAFIPHAFAWTTILTYLAVFSNFDRSIVHTTVLTTFLLDFSFPIMLFLQWRGRGLFQDYASGEIAFTILSILSKNSLAWMTFLSAN